MMIIFSFFFFFNYIESTKKKWVFFASYYKIKIATFPFLEFLAFVVDLEVDIPSGDVIGR